MKPLPPNADALFEQLRDAVGRRDPRLARGMSRYREALLPMLHEALERAHARRRTTLWDRFGGQEEHRKAGDQAAALLDHALRLMEDPDLAGTWYAALGYDESSPEEQEEALQDLLDYMLVPDEDTLHVLLTLAMATQGRWYAESTTRVPRLPGEYSPRYSDAEYEMPRWLAEAILADWLAGAGERLRILPISKETAQAFIEQHHTQLPYLPRRQLYAVGAFRGDRLVAVATAGHPGGRFDRADGGRNVLELSRIASDGTVPGASSMLAAFLLKAAPKSKRGDPREPWLFVTYSLGSEEGNTYKALADLGLRPVGLTSPKGRAGGARQAETGSLREERKVVWEAGPAARPAVDLAELLTEARQKSPEPLYFASGSNEVGYIRGLDEAGHPIGVAAPYVTRASLSELERVSVPVFVDSGAFSEVEFQPDEGFVKVRELDWPAVFDVYDALAHLGPQLYVVAPDRVGDQVETLARMAEWAPRIQALHRAGVNIIVPVQRGELPMHEMWAKALAALGLRQQDPGVIAGIPSKKDATPVVELQAFLILASPRALHFLGVGPNSPRWPELLKRARGASNVPSLRISHDSAAVPALVGRQGRPRPLTVAQDQAREEIRGQRWTSPQEADQDYTEALGDLFWLPAADRKRIAAEWSAPTGKKGFAEWFATPDGEVAVPDVLAVWEARLEGRAGAEERKRRSIRQVMQQRGNPPGPPPSEVVALYIDPKRGPYPDMGLDCWGVERDACRYEGPDPVVAHPPCAHWGQLAWRAKTPDKHCGPRAVEQVQAYGGVLEHPARSKLWAAHDLPPPRPWPTAEEQASSYTPTEYTIELDQCDWGHPCRKKTWIYAVGVPFSAWGDPPPPGEPTHVIDSSSAQKRRGESRAGPAQTLRHLPKSKRHITPPDFAEFLVHLAQHAQAPRLNRAPGAWLDVDTTIAAARAAAERGVSEVARSKRGFLRAYVEVDGDVERLKRRSPPGKSHSWWAERNGFVKRHRAQLQDGWKNGAPTRRHLALAVWAWSPDADRLRRWLRAEGYLD